MVMACCGDVPTLETLAAVEILRQQFPELKIRVINVVDLMTLQPQSEHPHGLSDKDFDVLFTKDKPIIFAYPRISLADPSPDISPDQSQESPRARVQGKRNDHHAF